MKKNKITFNQILILLGIAGMMGFIIYNYTKEKKANVLLNDSVQVPAILIEKNEGNTHAPPSGEFKYKVGRRDYSFTESGKYGDIQVGDTVLIKYAVKDPSVASVVDKYYMNKYQDLK
jgi:hypothetical protein